MRTDCETCGRRLHHAATRCAGCFELVEPRLQSAIDRCYADSNVVSDSDRDTYRTPETFRAKVELLFPRIEEFAASQQSTTQTPLIGDGIDVWALKHYLGAVSAIEHWDGRPLLTSVVINGERGFPADGYFKLVERLDGLPNDITDWLPAKQEEWWQDELAAVYEYWDR